VLETTRVSRHSRSLKMAPFDGSYMI